MSLKDRKGYGSPSTLKFTQNIHIYVIGPSQHQSTIEVSALYPTLYSLKGNPTCEHVTQAGFFFLLE